MKLKTWNFQGYLKNRMWKFQGSIKKEVEFLGVIEKNSWGISMDLGFWPWNCKWCQTKFCGISRCVWNFVLSGIFIGKVTNLKISGFFFSKKYILNLHALSFFLEKLIIYLTSRPYTLCSRYKKALIVKLWWLRTVQSRIVYRYS